MSNDLKQNAKKEADIIISQAELQADKIIHQAHGRLTELIDEINDLKRQRAEFEGKLSGLIETHRRLLDLQKEAREESQIEDVVILPAFGVTIEMMEQLSHRGCTLVDTTCGSVLNVWKNVRRYAEGGYTSLIHGKVSHEETRATASQRLCGKHLPRPTAPPTSASPNVPIRSGVKPKHGRSGESRRTLVGGGWSEATACGGAHAVPGDRRSGTRGT